MAAVKLAAAGFGRMDSILDEDAHDAFAPRWSALADAPEDEKIKALLDFSVFAEQPAAARPNPFDDPYVAALVTNERNELLGLHRKRQRQEKHAEPQAILSTMLRLPGSGTAELIGKIESAYKEKIWLISHQNVTRFESYFNTAADEIRKATRSEHLFLYSTLEPCLDYEAQPSCACLLCAAGFARVLYASDDTNPKGKGRSILETGKRRNGNVITLSPPLVTPNLAADSALKANRLFYSAGSTVSRFFEEVALGQNTSASAYCVYSLEANALSVSAPDRSGRIGHLYKDATSPPIYTAAISELGLSPDHKASRIAVSAGDETQKVNAILNGRFDENMVMIMREAASAELITILHDAVIHDLALPKTIICTHALQPFRSNLPDSLRKKGVFVYEHAFRKHHELYAAHKHIMLSELRHEFAEYLYVLIKLDDPDPVSPSASQDPYLGVFDRREPLIQWMKGLQQQPHRLSIFASKANSNEALELVSALVDGQFFRSLLARASVQIRICGDVGDGFVDTQVRHLQGEIGRLQVSNRVTVFAETSVAKVDASVINTILARGALNPALFSIRFLKNTAQSLNWRDRRNAGIMFAEMVKKDARLLPGLLLQPINTIVETGLSDENWHSLCTYLNAIDKIPNGAAQQYQNDIRKTLEAVAEAAETTLASMPALRWMQDVLWRWSASWPRFSDNAYLQPFALENIRRAFLRDDFLFSQAFVHLALNSRRAEFWRNAELLANIAPLDANVARTTAITIARLAYALRELGEQRSAADHAKFAAYLSEEAAAQFSEELERCAITWQSRLGAIELAQGEEEKGRRFATLLNLRAIIPMLTGGSSEVGSLREALSAVQTWRLDQNSEAHQTLRELSPKSVIAALRGLVSDVDVATKWAGISYTIGSASSALTEAVAVTNDKTGGSNLRLIRRELISAALKGPQPHYWLLRETFTHYRQVRERVKDADDSDWLSQTDPSLPGLATISAIRDIFFTADDELHPEVVMERKRYRRDARAIALVLPPIEFPSDNTETAKNGGSPPLGLGQIATTLSSAAHFVELFDAHRHPADAVALAQELLTFDIVGISAVISTVRSIRQLTVEIERQARRREGRAKMRPTLVVGGHAPSIMDPAVIQRELGVVDFIVVGAGEEALLSIAESELGNEVKRTHQTCEVISVAHLASSTTPRAKKSDLNRNYAQVWGRLPWLERDHFKRRLFSDPYEPAMTRDHKRREAHVVMTRGCNWTCQFCTEALIGSSYGEMRRPAADVVDEVRRLIINGRADRIQFVDDNVLPSNPARRETTPPDAAVLWSEAFLNGLTQLKAQIPRFSWRGLMRLEDFSHYDGKFADFTEKLARSGCNLLAFGIESGVQAQRDKLKSAVGPTLTNEEIMGVVARLSGVKVRTKGYFILGGPNQSERDIADTIAFACTSGLSLAYFAIYKDFRGLSAAKDVGNKLGFSVFAQKLDACLSEGTAAQWQDAFGKYLPFAQAKAFRAVYRKLAASGFAFGDLIKYNDFHTDSQFFIGLGFQDSRDYLQLLATAYANFYCRPQWPLTYKALLSAGY